MVSKTQMNTNFSWNPSAPSHAFTHARMSIDSLTIKIPAFRRVPATQPDVGRGGPGCQIGTRYETISPFVRL